MMMTCDCGMMTCNQTWERRQSMSLRHLSMLILPSRMPSSANISSTSWLEQPVRMPRISDTSIYPEPSRSIIWNTSSMRSLQSMFRRPLAATTNSVQLMLSPWLPSSSSSNSLALSSDMLCLRIALSISSREREPSPFLSISLKILVRTVASSLFSYWLKMQYCTAMSSLLCLKKVRMLRMACSTCSRGCGSVNLSLNQRCSRHCLAEGRSAGSILSMRLTRSCPAAEMCMLTRGWRSNCPRRMVSMICLLLAPPKGGVPVSRMQRMTPMDHTSHFSLQFFFITSGARQYGVPISSFMLPLSLREHPKSTILMVGSPFFAKSTFSGLRSRCTMPWAWQQLMACSMVRMTSQAWRSSKRVRETISSKSSPPSSSSVTMQIARWSSYRSNTFTILGWSIPRRMVNSLLRACTSLALSFSLFTCFIARLAAVFLFFMQYTFPQLPSPRVFRQSYTSRTLPQCSPMRSEGSRAGALPPFFPESAPMQLPIRLVGTFDTIMSEARKSFGANRAKVGFRDLALLLVPYSFSSVRVALDHDEEFLRLFSEKLEWMTKPQYRELSQLCQALPGPSAAQVLVAVSSIISKSAVGGVVSFMLYCLPSAVLLSLLASAAREDNRDWLLECLAQLTGADVSSPELLSSFRAQAYVYYKLLAMGSQAACCSVLLHNVYKHYQHLSQKNEWFCRVLIGFSAVAIFYYQSDQVYKLTIVASLIMTIYATIDEKKPMSIVQRGLLQDLKRLSRFFGNLSIYLYLLLLGALWVLSSVFPHPLLCIAWDYFFIGSLVFGSGHSVFTALYLHTVINGAVDADLFWLGLPVMMLIPGPPSNFVIFLGFLMDRGVGALVAWLCFYLPCILSIYGFLPNWHRVRNLAALQRFCIGMRCFNLGVTLTTVPIVLLEAGKADLVLMLMIFMVTFVLSYAYERNYAAVIFLGALLANLRRWAVLYYREADYSFAI